MLSAFISKSSSSTTAGFSIFIVGSITQASFLRFDIYRLRVIGSMVITEPILSLQIVTAAGFPYNDSIGLIFRIVWSLFPPNLLAKALEILASATSPPHDTGIKWSGITKCSPSEMDCVITIVWNHIVTQSQSFTVVQVL